jgi:hypothetical protein
VGISRLTTDDQYRTSGHGRRDNRYNFQPNLIKARRLAWRLTTILPAMRLAEALETMRLHRVAGLTGPRTAVGSSCGGSWAREWLTGMPVSARLTGERRA